MHFSCSTCGTFDRLMGVPKPNDKDARFCSDECARIFRAWSQSRSALTIFSYYVQYKYPQAEVSP